MDDADKCGLLAHPPGVLPTAICNACFEESYFEICYRCLFAQGCDTPSTKNIAARTTLLGNPINPDIPGSSDVFPATPEHEIKNVFHSVAEWGRLLTRPAQEEMLIDPHHTGHKESHRPSEALQPNQCRDEELDEEESLVGGDGFLYSSHELEMNSGNSRHVLWVETQGLSGSTPENHILHPRGTVDGALDSRILQFPRDEMIYNAQYGLLIPRNAGRSGNDENISLEMKENHADCYDIRSSQTAATLTDGTGGDGDGSGVSHAKPVISQNNPRTIPEFSTNNCDGERMEYCFQPTIFPNQFIHSKGNEDFVEQSPYTSNPQGSPDANNDFDGGGVDSETSYPPTSPVADSINSNFHSEPASDRETSEPSSYTLYDMDNSSPIIPGDHPGSQFPDYNPEMHYSFLPEEVQFNEMEIEQRFDPSYGIQAHTLGIGGAENGKERFGNSAYSGQSGDSQSSPQILYTPGPGIATTQQPAAAQAKGSYKESSGHAGNTEIEYYDLTADSPPDNNYNYHPVEEAAPESAKFSKRPIIQRRFCPKPAAEIQPRSEDEDFSDGETPGVPKGRGWTGKQVKWLIEFCSQGDAPDAKVPWAKLPFEFRARFGFSRTQASFRSKWRLIVQARDPETWARSSDISRGA